MIEKKTLGQVLYEAQWPKSNYGAVDKTSCIREAAGIAAVACYIIDERIAKHVESYHANELSDDEAKTLLSLPVAHEHGVSRDPPKPEAASETDNWAYGTITEWHVIRDAVPTIPTSELKALAKDIHEAAERHYSALRSAMNQSQAMNRRLIQERDAAVAECERLKDLVGHCWVHSGYNDCGYDYMDSDMRELYDRVKNIREDDKPTPAAAPSPAPAATGEDELRLAISEAAKDNLHGLHITGDGFDAAHPMHIHRITNRIRPLFDAVRAERDRAIEADRTAVKGQLPVVCTKCFYTPGTNRSKYCGDGSDKDNGHRWTKVEELVKRAEAAEAERDKLAAELGEVRDAVAWSWSMEKHYLFYGYLPDAILAAFRATKGKEPTP